MKGNLRFGWCLAAVVSVLAGAPAGAATVTFTLGNVPQPGEENILQNKGDNGFTIPGVTNTSSVLVQFSSTTDELLATANGQADIQPFDTSGGNLINDITTTVPGGTFGDLIIDPKLTPGSKATPSATVTAHTTDGTTNTFTYTLENGENFLTIVADAGFSMDFVTVDSSNGFLSFRHPRISGVAGGTIPPSSVPEPGSLALLSSLLTAGVLFRRRLAR